MGVKNKRFGRAVEKIFIGTGALLLVTVKNNYFRSK